MLWDIVVPLGGHSLRPATVKNSTVNEESFT
jgi:hypothetical protein